MHSVIIAVHLLLRRDHYWLQRGAVESKLKGVNK
jgi:hypothetical protein